MHAYTTEGQTGAGVDRRPGLSHHSRLWDLYTLRDEYSQADAFRSFYGRNDSYRLLEPVVSRYLYEQGYRPDLPEDRPFAVCLTHDIDDIYPPLAHRALAAIHYAREGDLGGIRREIAWKKDADGHYSYRNFREIMAIEERYGAKSSFYFMATDRNIQPGRLYDVETLGGEMGEIVDRGWEVGLHGGYYSYDRPDAIKKEKERLEKALGRSVCGYRNHWLRFQVPDTWEYLEAAGFRYDTTIGYNDFPGFRNGMCYPYRPFSLKTGRTVGIVEIPLAIMDCSLFTAARTPAEAWEIARRIIDNVERCHGVITLLWHNNVFEAAYRSDWKIIYNKILKYCYDKNAWMTGGEEISRLSAFYDGQASG